MSRDRLSSDVETSQKIRNVRWWSQNFADGTRGRLRVRKNQSAKSLPVYMYFTVEMQTRDHSRQASEQAASSLLPEYSFRQLIFSSYL